MNKNEYQLCSTRSMCKGIWLHRFSIVKDYGTAIEERCEICGQQVVFQVRNGRPNNLEYIEYHNRQCLIPGHPLFSHEYTPKNTSQR